MWLNITKAAAYAGVDRAIMRRWLNDGLRHSRIGKITRIHPDNIDEYLRQYETTGRDIAGEIKSALEGIA